MSRLVTSDQYIYIKKFGQEPGLAKFTGPGLDLLVDSLELTGVKKVRNCSKNG